MMTSTPRGASWRPTTSHLRAVGVGFGLALVSVATHRPDLLVLGAPLLMIGIWAALTRPTGAMHVTSRLGSARLREGESTTLTVKTWSSDGMRDVVVILPAQPFVETIPATGVATKSGSGGRPQIAIVVRSTRWGFGMIGPAVVAASSDWGAFRWGPAALDPMPYVTLPVPVVFDSRSPTPHPAGLVGVSRSRRPGEGSEFASIRPFQVGDRLRRIHWPVSLRTGALHVTSTWADQDSQVMLVVDATTDLGVSEGIGGSSSSLDTTVRAAGALAEHYLRRGDRVGLRVFGKASRSRVPAAAGMSHLGRVLDLLATITPGTRDDVALRRAHLGVESGALVLLLSPMTSPFALEHVVSLARRGLTVVIVDTLPVVGPSADDDLALSVAWRIRVLEREPGVRGLRQVGIPIATWRGPGSLDPVLRAIARRSDAPRLARR